MIERIIWHNFKVFNKF